MNRTKPKSKESNQAPPKQTPVPRYVEFVRVSSSGQEKKDTPELQKAALARLRLSRPGILVDEIEAKDGFISGALPLARRPDLLELQALSKARAFDELRVVALDRLTRSDDPRERAAVLGMVMDAGAVIVDASGAVTDPRTQMGALMGDLSLLFASWERDKIRARTSAGRAAAAAKGRWIGGAMVPYGLRWLPMDKEKKTDGELVIVKESAEVVRRLFAAADAGKPLDVIAASLDADGIPSPGGTALWRGSTVQRILRHPVYCGDGIRVTTGGVKDTKDGKHVTIGGVTHTLPAPAIVDRDLWVRVQAALTARNHRRSASPRSAILALVRGFARCGCGQAMDTTTWATTGGRRKVVYSCRSARRIYGPRCSKKNYKHDAAAVDGAVWDALAAQLRDPDLLREAAAAGDSGDSGDKDATWAKQVASCARELKKLEKHEGEVLRHRSRGDLSEAACASRLREIKGQRETLERSAEVARQALTRGKVLGTALKNVEARVSAIREGLADADFTTRRLLVQEVIPALAGYGVTIHQDGRIVIQGALALAAEPFQQESRSLPCARS